MGKKRMTAEETLRAALDTAKVDDATRKLVTDAMADIDADDGDGAWEKTRAAGTTLLRLAADDLARAEWACPTLGSAIVGYVTDVGLI